MEESFNELYRLATEAEDNAKFLSTLERSFRTLTKGSFSEIARAMPGLVDSM
jgi:dynein heavy chain